MLSEGVVLGMGTKVNEPAPVGGGRNVLEKSLYIHQARAKQQGPFLQEPSGVWFLGSLPLLQAQFIIQLW